MKPVDQEFVHRPEVGQYGDCQRAVLASLLELPITEVPHFLALSNNDVGDYWDRLQAFCRARGLAYLTMPARCGALFFGEAGDVFHEIAGPSPRGNGVTHAVVGCNGQIVFDPHPSRAGLAGDPAKWEHSYLVAVAPVKAAPIPFSGADEAVPVFGRRWSIAADGFGLQRDDDDGAYVHIDDALSTLHESLAVAAAT